NCPVLPSAAPLSLLPAHRARAVRAVLAVFLGVFAALALTSAAPAGASPLDDPHLGGIGFSGPATGDLAAVYWNPAALGLLHNPQLMVAGTGSRITTTVQRAPIDPMTGLPAAGPSLPATRSTVTT